MKERLHIKLISTNTLLFSRNNFLCLLLVLFHPDLSSSMDDKTQAVSRLLSTDTFVRSDAVKELRDMPQEAAVQSIIKSLDEEYAWKENPEARRLAYEILADKEARRFEFGYRRLVQGLNDDGVSDICVRALAKDEADTMTDVIRDLSLDLISGDIPDHTTINVLEALRQHGAEISEASQAAGFYMFNANEDRPVRSAAARALVEIAGPSEIISMLPTMNEKEKKISVSALHIFYLKSGYSYGATTLEQRNKIHEAFRTIVLDQLTEGNLEMRKTAIEIIPTLMWSEIFVKSGSGEYTANQELVERFQRVAEEDSDPLIRSGADKLVKSIEYFISSERKQRDLQEHFRKVEAELNSAILQN